MPKHDYSAHVVAGEFGTEFYRVCAKCGKIITCTSHLSGTEWQSYVKGDGTCEEGTDDETQGN